MPFLGNSLLKKLQIKLSFRERHGNQSQHCWHQTKDTVAHAYHHITKTRRNFPRQCKRKQHFSFFLPSTSFPFVPKNLSLYIHQPHQPFSSLTHTLHSSFILNRKNHIKTCFQSLFVTFFFFISKNILVGYKGYSNSYFNICLLLFAFSYIWSQHTNSRNLSSPSYRRRTSAWTGSPPPKTSTWWSGRSL